MPTCKKYPQEIIEYVIANHKGIGPTEMAGILNDKFGTSYTKEQIKGLYGRNKLNSGVTGYFEKGKPAINKGKKWDEYMTKEAQEKSLETAFHKGNVPFNHAHVGSIAKRTQHSYRKEERETAYVYYIKVSEPNKWVPLHRLNFEAAYGPVPKGHVIVFADGNRLNAHPENLVAVPRSLMTTINQWMPEYHSRQELETLILIAKNKQAIAGIKQQKKKHYKECWKDIPGYGGKYQASTKGNIRRVYKNGEHRLLSLFIRKTTKKMDLYVKLSDGVIAKDHKVSILVYRTWVSDIYDGSNIIHVNGMLTDNAPSNLKAVKKESLGKMFGYKSKSKPVVQLDSDGNILCTYRSAREAAKENGMSYQTVIDRANGKVKKTLAPDGKIYRWQDSIKD